MDYDSKKMEKDAYSPLSAEKLENIKKGTVSDEIFSKIGAGSVDSIKAAISDINALIASRQELHKKIISDLERVEVDINNFLANNQQDMPKEELILFKEKSIELAESRRQEMLNCWRDIARLKEELRGYQREITDKQSRLNVLDSILSGD